MPNLFIFKIKKRKKKEKKKESLSKSMGTLHGQNLLTPPLASNATCMTF